MHYPGGATREDFEMTTKTDAKCELAQVPAGENDLISGKPATKPAKVLQLTSRAKMGKAKKPAVRLSAEFLNAATTDTRPLSAKAQIHHRQAGAGRQREGP
jgi:hypothetical protein